MICEEKGDRSLRLKILKKINPFRAPSYPSIKSRIYFVIGGIIGFVLIMGLFTLVDMPWLQFKFPVETILLSLPLITATGFGVAGFRFTAIVKNGQFVRGWLIALMISLFYGLITNSNILLPHRHFEYIMYPLAVIAAYGIGATFSDPDYTILLTKLKDRKEYFVHQFSREKKITYKNRLFNLIVIILLVALMGSTVYSVHQSLNQSMEEITRADLNALEWMEQNLDKNSSLIASDHRLERMCEASGFNATKDEALIIWEAETFDEFINELLGIGKNYSRITHIFLDNIMVDNLVHLSIKHGTSYMTEPSYNKFQSLPFKLVYPEEQLYYDPLTNNPISWAEIYEVDWEYIDSYNMS
jgi:hypothetical protein